MNAKLLMIAVLTTVPLLPAAADTLINATNSTPVNIPDNDPNFGGSSGLYLSPTDPVVLANPYVVNVSLVFSLAGTGSGAWAGDYTLTLRHIGEDNSSQSLTLFSSLPYGNDGFDQVTVTSAAGSLDNVSAGYSATPISGTYGGVDFSVFQNISTAGEWVLTATDNSSLNQGTLTGWTLTLDVVPEPGNLALALAGGFLGCALITRSRKNSKMRA